jgi:hypothetical protein
MKAGKANFYPIKMESKATYLIIRNFLNLLRLILLIIAYLRDLQLEVGKTRHLKISSFL